MRKLLVSLFFFSLLAHALLFSSFFIISTTRTESYSTISTATSKTRHGEIVFDVEVEATKSKEMFLMIDDVDMSKKETKGRSKIKVTPSFSLESSLSCKDETLQKKTSSDEAWYSAESGKTHVFLGRFHFYSDCRFLVRLMQGKVSPSSLVVGEYGNSSTLYPFDEVLGVIYLAAAYYISAFGGVFFGAAMALTLLCGLYLARRLK